jgi:hypothetical protein
MVDAGDTTATGILLDEPECDERLDPENGVSTGMLSVCGTIMYDDMESADDDADAAETELARCPRPIRMPSLFAAKERNHPGTRV